MNPRLLTSCMDFRYLRIFGATLAALALLGVAGGQAEEKAAPFAPGEKLTYDVTWSIFRAGEVSATLQRTTSGADDAYEVVTTARSQGFVSLLYDVQNEFRSFFDPQSVCSQRIEKSINEGRRHKQTQIVFNGGRQLAILDEHDLTHPKEPAKHVENAAPSCTEDVVTAFYYLRRQDFQVGKVIRLPVNDGSRTYDVAVEVQARERIQTPLGLREAFRVEPKVFSGLFKRKGRMLIWFSDDAQHLPLRIKAMIAVGSITGDLKAVSEQPTASATHSKP